MPDLAEACRLGADGLVVRPEPLVVAGVLSAVLFTSLGASAYVMPPSTKVIGRALPAPLQEVRDLHA